MMPLKLDFSENLYTKQINLEFNKDKFKTQINRTMIYIQCIKMQQILF